MGAGIAHAFLCAGRDVVVVEVSAQAAAAARGRIEATLRRTHELGRLEEPVASVLTRLHTTSDVAVVGRAGLVVEAVPEDVVLKRSVLSSIERSAPRAWLASNTSSLSIDGLAQALEQPERLIGLHFFNPVPASELVEVVVGSATSPQLVDLARGWVAELGKIVVTVRDSPGFASSRLGVALALEAMRMLDDGVASATDIDAAMTSGYKHSIGPLRTTDLVGLDVRLAVAEHLARELGDRFAPPQVLRDLVAAGHLGRKTGRGFYDWA
jgi:3-hydroxybutyryl-CoA dehydrogenase